MNLGTLAWLPALENLELVAPSTADALTRWAQVEPRVTDEVVVAPIDPQDADTAALTAAYALPPSASVNCVLVAGRREGTEKIAAALVRATTRADVNSTVKRLLDVRKCSFLPMERATEESGMEYGGITPVGLPDGYRLLLDGRVPLDDPDAGGMVVIGSGVRHSKLALPGALLATMPGVEVVEGLAL